MTYLYASLVILVIALPTIAAFGYAAKRGKSTRRTVFFVLPYVALLALLFFWLEGFSGFALAVATVVVVAVGAPLAVLHEVFGYAAFRDALAFYVYTEIVDIGLGYRRKR